MARIYEAIEGVLLPLGRRGENEALEVRVNIAQWIADYGNGSFGGLAQRYTEDKPYPVTITVDGDYACWLVTDVDTAIEGYGKFELDYIVGGVLAKSVMWRTKVQPSVAEPGPVPDPYESWVEEVLAAGASVLNKIDKVAGATDGDIPQLAADGTLSDSGIAANNVSQNSAALVGAIPISGMQAAKGGINSSNVWTGVLVTTYTHVAIPIAPGDLITVVGNASATSIVAVLKSYTPPTANGQTPDYSTQAGFTTIISIMHGASTTFTAPSDAAYLVADMLFNSADTSPATVLVNGYDITQTVAENIVGISNMVEVASDGAFIHMDDFSVRMQKHGNNNLMDLYQIYKSDGTLIYTGSSDWQGPYVVDAISNADGDAIAAGRDYTGGNHPYGPGAEGTATGATLSFAVYADGKAVAPGSSAGWVDCVVVEWENEVQAWNTKKSDGSGRAVLHERPRWTFHRDGTVEVQNTILATEDILIYHYYGIQMQAAWLSSGFFLPSVSREFKTVADLNALCGGYAHGLSTVGYNANIAICMGYDPFSDLGSGDGLKDWEVGRIHMSNTKMYTKMCDEMSLSQGESASYRGYYKFLLPENIEGFVSPGEYVRIVKNAVAGNLPKLKADGGIEDSGIAASKVALQDGYYEGLTAGAADSLTGRGDGVPADFTFRPTGGGADVADGTATFASLRGNTVFWNQKARNGNFEEGTTGWSSGRATLSAEAGVLTATVNTAGIVDLTLASARRFDVFAGRKYFVLAQVKSPKNVNAYIMLSGTVSANALPVQWVANTETTASGVITADTDIIGSGQCLAIRLGGSGVYAIGDTISVSRAMVFDLTAMFGVGNEPTADEFRELFPLFYYTPQQAPVPLHYNGTGVQTVGFNQWDEVWEIGSISSSTGANSSSSTSFRSKNFIPVFPDTDYYFNYEGGYGDSQTGSRLYPRWYDANKNYIGSSTSLIQGITTSPPNARYLRFVVSNATQYQDDITINLSWSGYRNGEYEAYWTQTRELPVETYFPTGMKSAGDAYDELRNDKAIKRIDSVDAGSLTWGYSTTYASPLFYATVPDAAEFAVLAGYTKAPGDYADMPDKTYIYNAANSRLTIRDDAYSDAASFKAALTGVSVFYEMSSPVETAISPPLNLFYRVSDFGTERSLPDNTATPATAPMKAMIIYGLNIQDTVRRLPINYISKASFDNLAVELSDTLGVGITATYNEDTEAYEFTITDERSLRIVPVPASATAAGTAGNIAFDVNYLYVCVTGGDAGEALWKRVALSAMS